MEIVTQEEEAALSLCPMQEEPDNWRIEGFPILLLPSELILCVLGVLTTKELCSMARTCRTFRNMCEENTIWKSISEKKWDFEAQHSVTSWKRYFLQRTAIEQPKAFNWELPNWKSHDKTAPDAIPQVPTPRMAHTGSVVADNRLVFIGGQVTPTIRFNDIFVLDMNTMTFTKPVLKKGSPHMFARHTSTAVGNKVFCFGGFDGVSTLYGLGVFNVDDNTWEVPEVKGDIPKPRTNHACTTVGRKIYIHGGNVTMNDVYTVLNDFYVLDTDTMTWECLKTFGEVPSARSSHRMVTVGNKIYLYGGGVWTPTPSSRWVVKYNDIFSFDTETRIWCKLKTTGELQVCTFTMPFALGPFVFVFGGQSTITDYCTNYLYCFDTVSNHWSEIKCDSAELTKKRDVGTINLCGDQIVLFAGSSGGPINDLNILKPAFKITELFSVL
jgi:N-acetylneuraminic acid mutarotase